MKKNVQIGGKMKKNKGKKYNDSAGIEPRISGSVDQRLIHWATESTVHFNYQGHIELIRPITRIGRMGIWQYFCHVSPLPDETFGRERRRMQVIM